MKKNYAIDQLISFVVFFYKMVHIYWEILFRSREVAESIKALQTVDLKEVHEQNWKTAEDRARLKKAGLTMGFDVSKL